MQVFAIIVVIQQVYTQQAGVYDFGQARYGETRGSWTPGQFAAFTLLSMFILAGLAYCLSMHHYIYATLFQTETKRNDTKQLGQSEPVFV